MDEESDALDAMPFDEEVRELERAGEEYERAYDVVTRWQKLGLGMRGVLVVGNVLMVLSVYLVMGLGGMCFREFTMSDNIHDDLDGEGFSLIKLPGWVAIGMVGVSGTLLWFWSVWAGRVTRRAMVEGVGVGGGGEENAEGQL